MAGVERFKRVDGVDRVLGDAVVRLRLNKDPSRCVS